MKKISIKTDSRNQFVDITSQVAQFVRESGITSGFVYCFVPHTTAGITINENADPDVKRDLLYKLEKIIPKQDGYHHAEGNSDSHLKASLFGFSEQILIENGRLVLGQWQGIYFCEFDGPRNRSLVMKAVSLD